MLLFSLPAEICLTEHLTSGSRVHKSSHEHNKSPVLTHQYKNSVCVVFWSLKTLCYLKLQSIYSIIIWNCLNVQHLQYPDQFLQPKVSCIKVFYCFTVTVNINLHFIFKCLCKQNPILPQKLIFIALDLQ